MFQAPIRAKQRKNIMRALVCSMLHAAVLAAVFATPGAGAFARTTSAETNKSLVASYTVENRQAPMPVMLHAIGRAPGQSKAAKTDQVLPVTEPQDKRGTAGGSEKICAPVGRGFG
jgi:hypothetical protein